MAPDHKKQCKGGGKGVILFCFYRRETGKQMELHNRFVQGCHIRFCPQINRSVDHCRIFLKFVSISRMNQTHSSKMRYIWQRFYLRFGGALGTSI